MLGCVRLSAALPKSIELGGSALSRAFDSFALLLSLLCVASFCGVSGAVSAAAVCPYPASLEVTGESVDSTDLKQACQSVETTDLEVTSGALLGVQAGDAVTLSYGTRVDFQSTIQVNVASPDLSAITLSDTSVQALDKVYIANLPPELQSVSPESMAPGVSGNGVISREKPGKSRFLRR
jgi:hypothetical protein